jgi:hypothetical protein
VQVAQSHIAWHGDTPPDGGLAAVQRDFQFVDLRRLGCLRSLPDCLSRTVRWFFRHISLLFCVSYEFCKIAGAFGIITGVASKNKSNFQFDIYDLRFPI